jgi:hypothetical protein
MSFPFSFLMIRLADASASEAQKLETILQAALSDKEVYLQSRYSVHCKSPLHQKSFADEVNNFNVRKLYVRL